MRKFFHSLKFLFCVDKMVINNDEQIKEMLLNTWYGRAQQFYTEKKGDTTFIVESERIIAHREVLAALSPKYKVQFSDSYPNEDEIHIPDVSAAAFREYLQFFYEKNVTLTMENIEVVLDLAKQSLNDKFVDICANFLENKMTINNLCPIFNLALIYDIESLRAACELKIIEITKEIFASTNFSQCNRDSLLRIAKLSVGNCDEQDTLNACMAWARAQCAEKGLNENSIEDVKTVLGEEIYNGIEITDGLGYKVKAIVGHLKKKGVKYLLVESDPNYSESSNSWESEDEINKSFLNQKLIKIMTMSTTKATHKN